MIINCWTCQKEIKTFPCLVKNGRKKYCSKTCQYGGKSFFKKCLFCGKEFKTYKSRQAKGRGKCCSSRCSRKWLWQNPLYREKNIQSHTGKLGYWKGKKRPDIGMKVAQKLKGRKLTLTLEQRKRRSDSAKKNGFQKGHIHSLAVRNKLRLARIRQVMFKKDTDIEIAIQKILKQNNINFEKQVPLENICRADIYIPNEKKVIFCDGDYWHNLPGYKERDSNQNKVLTSKGYKVIRLWEHEIKNDLQGCLERISK